MKELDIDTIRVIIEAVGSFDRYSRAIVKAKGRTTGYRSLFSTVTRERICAFLWASGYNQTEIREIMGYRSSGTVSRMLKRFDLRGKRGISCRR